MSPAFKPKKAFIHVPGFGVVTREDFSKEHTEALLKRAAKHGVNQNDFISQHLVIASYGDLEIFSEGPEDNGKGTAEDVKPRAKKGKKQLSDDEKLEAMIAEEELQSKEIV